MSRRELKDAKPFDIRNEAEYINLKARGTTVVVHSCTMTNPWARVQIGKYGGPGRYYLLQYSQGCPKGCCYDSVNEVLCDAEFRAEVAEEIRELRECYGEERV